MRSYGSLGYWLGAGALLGALLVGCGGSSDNSPPPGDDSGGDGTADSSSDSVAPGDSNTATDAGDGSAVLKDGTVPGDASDAGEHDSATVDATDGTVSTDGSDGSTTTTDAADGSTMTTDGSDGSTTTKDASDSSTTETDAADSSTSTDSGDAATKVDASDAAAQDGMAPDAADSATADANDASAVCGDGAASAPCVNPSTGANDFCTAGVCSACTDVTDDSTCTTAYGGAGHPYLCLAGACTPGDCRTSADCTTNTDGTLCGVNTPNMCGKCTTDTQCAKAGADGGSLICDTATGACVAPTCTPGTGNPPTVCSANSSDVCCSTNVCQPGTCCPGSAGDAFCAAQLDAGAATCSAKTNTCTTCPPVTGNVYAVDPINGNDQTGNGNAGTAGCAFQTITRALQVVGTPANPTTVEVLGPATVNAGETFPLILADDVNLTTSGGAVTIDVTAAKSGFTLSAPNSSIYGATGAPLTISGQTNTATNGIVVTTGSAASTQISNLTVTGFEDDGILVQLTGILTVGEGVTSTLNGTTAARHDGLHVTGTGSAIITVPQGSTPTHFDGNTNHGILVDGSGSITLTGSVINGTAGTGTVTTNGNYAAGLWIAQTAGTVIAPTPVNTVNGLVAFGNTNGNGIRIVPGSAIKLRNSAALGNEASGINVSNAAAVGGSNDITHIDLGSPATADAGADYGNNTLQEALGTAGHNGSVGICLDVRAAAEVLLAAGNIFGTTNCASALGDAGAPVLTSNATCGAGADLGIMAGGFGGGGGNDINVSVCTHQ